MAMYAGEVFAHDYWFWLNLCVLQLLAAGTGQVRAAILRLGGGDVDSDERREVCAELTDVVASARAARARLNARLVKRIERILGQSIRRL
ncbi:hypothetical protein [Streptomyces carpinensis]|uniref:Uncharacterized protein n=1 Tax=Streptomyces carpinensis TaxID=66369 RepID=A0ABV1VXU2_9ACTN|nr:hypothetical protein [Streptomyces carpinensis]